MINTDDFESFENYEDSLSFVVSTKVHKNTIASDYVVINTSKQEFLAISDSVKTILINDSDTIVVSENYGVISVNSEYQIIGYSNQVDTLGIENLTTSQVYNFSVGDEFHYFKEDFFGMGASYVLESISKILDKRMDVNEVTYDIETIEKRTTGEEVDYDTIQSSQIYSLNPQINQLPNVYIASSTGLDYVVRMNVQDSTISKKVFYKRDFEAYQYPERYVMGLGGAYYDYTGPVSPDNSNELRRANELVYYKKGNEEVGTPLVLNIWGEQKNQSVSVYPNPVSNTLTISGYCPILCVYCF